MNEQRDHALGAALRELDLPMERADFWDELGRELYGLPLAGSGPVPTVVEVETAVRNPSVPARVLAGAAVLILVVLGSLVYAASLGPSEGTVSGPAETGQGRSAASEIPTTTVSVEPFADFGNLTYASIWLDQDVTLIDGAWAEAAIDEASPVVRVSLHQAEVIGVGDLLGLVYLRTTIEGRTWFDVYAITDGESGPVVSEPSTLGEGISNIALTLTVLDEGLISLKVVFREIDVGSRSVLLLLREAELVHQRNVEGSSLLSDTDVLDSLSYPTEWLDGDVTLSQGQWVEVGSDGNATTTRFSADRIIFFEDPEPIALVVLTVDRGRPGTFYDLYAVTAEGNELVVSRPFALGNRVTDITLARAIRLVGDDAIQVGYVRSDGLTYLSNLRIISGELIEVR